MKEDKKLVPELRFPEFREAEGWTEQFGDALFDQISDKKPEPGLPVLAITQEHGAIPRHMIDYHVSVTEKSIESYKVVQVGDFIISLRSFQGGIEYSQYQGICSPAYVVLRRHGGGGGACDDDTNSAGGAGGRGAVRLVWGRDLSFPSAAPTGIVAISAQLGITFIPQIDQY